jgi:cell division protease FtsH
MNNAHLRKNQSHLEKKNSDDHHSIWLPVIWFLAIWISISFIFGRFRGVNRVEIPYSVFKQQVRERNVEQVTITGQQIEGEFAEPYQGDAAEGDGEARSYQLFSTIKPAVEDPEFVSLLDEYGVLLSAELQEGTWLVYAFINLLPWVLIIGFFVYTSRKAGQQMQSTGGTGGLFGVGRSRARRYYKIKKQYFI